MLLPWSRLQLSSRQARRVDCRGHTQTQSLFVGSARNDAIPVNYSGSTHNTPPSSSAERREWQQLLRYAMKCLVLICDCRTHTVTLTVWLTMLLCQRNAMGAQVPSHTRIKHSVCARTREHCVRRCSSRSPSFGRWLWRCRQQHFHDFVRLWNNAQIFTETTQLFSK